MNGNKIVKMCRQNVTELIKSVKRPACANNKKLEFNEILICETDAVANRDIDRLDNKILLCVY